MAITNVAPGKVAVGKAGDELRTILGSCVAVTLWQPQLHVGAATHIVLPARNQPPRRYGLDARYADEAWVVMCMQLAELGISPEACVCKIFGGARVFDHEFANMGQRNINSVRKVLNHCGMTITNEHVGGTGYRELRLNIDTGDAWVRHRAGTYRTIVAEVAA